MYAFHALVFGLQTTKVDGSRSSSGFNRMKSSISSNEVELQAERQKLTKLDGEQRSTSSEHFLCR